MKHRILILNDEPAVRSLLGTLLMIDGYECFEAETDREAVEILRKQAIDLIIQDMLRKYRFTSDPYAGCKFTRLIKSDPQFRHIPIVIISGTPEDKTIEMFKEVGISFEENVAGYLPLRSHEDTLISKVNAIISGTITGQSGSIP